MSAAKLVKAAVLFSSLSLGGCAYNAVSPSGARIEGFQSPLLSSTRVTGVDLPTVHGQQIDTLRASDNEKARCIGQLAAQQVYGGGTYDQLVARRELEVARRRALGQAAPAQLCAKGVM